MVCTRIVPSLVEWFGRHARDLPWRRTQDPYAIWVSEIMLQQTQVQTVIPYWERWMLALPTAQALAEAQPATLHKLWEGLGYYTRVRNMHRAAIVICNRHGGQFPSRFEEVLELPGIGRYTAGAICSIAFNQPAPILDGNVIRVLSRLYCIEGDPRSKRVNGQLWAIAGELVRTAASQPCRGRRRSRSSIPPLSGASACNQALMELGALICTPKTPRCTDCPLINLCAARERGCVDRLPERARRPRMMRRRILTFVLVHKRRVLVRQRPAGVVNAHLWEFPNVEVKNGGTSVEEAARQTLGVAPEQIHSFCTIKHSITRYRITTEAYKASTRSAAIARQRTGGAWTGFAALGQLPFASAHKKILQQLCRKDSHPMRGQRKIAWPGPASSAIVRS